MKTYTKVLVFGFALIAFISFARNAEAMTPILSLSSQDANNVSISVNGDPNSNVILHYNSNYGMQSSNIGYTNNFGYFSTTLNSNSYNINPNSYVYVIVNNQQSSSMLWPTSYNSYYYPSTSNTSGVNVSNLVLPVGGYATLSLGNNTSGLYVSNNSNPSIISTSTTSISTLGCTPGAQYSTLTGQPCYYNYNTPNTNNNQITINALYVGSSTLTICQNQNNACGTITINVINNAITGSVLGASTVGTSCYITRTLRLGMSGQDVSCLQNYLINKGYLMPNLNYNSYFDINTQNAVMMFQQHHYLVTDGIVGRQTKAYLY